MKEKQYSVTQIQQIIGISPDDLLKLIRKHSGKIRATTLINENGIEETFLDKDSLKKIIFLRQLESGFRLSVDEVCEVLDEKEFNTGKIEEFFDQTNPSVSFSKKFDAVEKEVITLRTRLTQMIIKYEYCLNQLSLNRAKNIALTNEIKKLKMRETALINQFNQSSHEDTEEIQGKDLN